MQLVIKTEWFKGLYTLLLVKTITYISDDTYRGNSISTLNKTKLACLNMYLSLGKL